MNNATFKQMLNEAIGNDCTEVSVVAGSAGDNAGTMVDAVWESSSSYSAAFIDAWIESAKTLLACCKEFKAAAPFYAAYGIVA
jgi:hypothetical protein